MRESVKLRQLAAAMEELEAMKAAYADDSAPKDHAERVSKDIHVRWLWGASFPGYEPMRRGVSALVAARWQEFRDEVFRQAEDRIKQLRMEIGLPVEVTITVEGCFVAYSTQNFPCDSTGTSKGTDRASDHVETNTHESNIGTSPRGIG